MALKWNPQGKRSRGRPRNTWRRDTESELKEQGHNWNSAEKLAPNQVRWRESMAYAPQRSKGLK